MLSNTIVAIVFGFIIFTFGSVIGFSQLFSMFKTKNTSGTSLLTYLFFIVCAMFSAIWGFIFFFAHMSQWVLEKDIPLIVLQLTIIPIILTYILELVGSTILAIIKIRHLNLAKKYKISELELSKVLLSKYKNKWEQYFPMLIISSVIILLVAITAVSLIVFTNPTINPGVPWLDEQEVLPVIITFSILGAASWEVMSWPQFIKCLKTRDTSGIAFNWALLMPISCTTSLVYSAIMATLSGNFTLDTIGALVFNGVIVNTGILVLKITNMLKAKRLNLSEIEYACRHKRKNKKRA